MSSLITKRCPVTAFVLSTTTEQNLGKGLPYFRWDLDGHLPNYFRWLEKLATSAQKRASLTHKNGYDLMALGIDDILTTE
jgi:hypothetical protein